MTDEVLSTVITPAEPTVSGGGAVPLTEHTQPKDVGKTSIGDTMRAELDKVRAAEKAEAASVKDEPKTEKPEEKPSVEPAEKAVPTPAQAQPDAAASEAKAKEAPAKPEQSAGKPYDQPPESVAPAARAKWANVPHELKQEWHRIDSAHRAAVAEYQEDRKFREELRDYEEMGKKVGISVKDAMSRYVEYDKRLNDANPLTRAKTVLELMVNSKVDPVAFAREIMKNEQAFAGQQQRGPQAPDPMLHQMMQKVEQISQRFEQQEMQAKAAPLQQTVEQWALDKPDFASLQEDIAEILQSGMIQKRYPGLATEDLLTEAYRRAGGSYISTAGTQPQAVTPSPEPDAPMRPANPDAGKKSITGAPTGGKTPMDTATGKSLRDLIQEEARRKRA